MTYALDSERDLTFTVQIGVNTVFRGGSALHYLLQTLIQVWFQSDMDHPFFMIQTIPDG